MEKVLGLSAGDKVMKLSELLGALQRKGLVFSSPGTCSIPQTSDV